MDNRFLLAFVACAFIFQLTVNSASAQFETVRWVKRDEIRISDLATAGWQHPRGSSTRMDLYVCRGQYLKNNTFVPGKFFTYTGEQAWIGYGGLILRTTNYELLVHPENSITWVQGKGHQLITPSHIFGGVDPEYMEEVYVCRANHTYAVGTTMVIPGKYVPSRGLCSIGHGDLEYLHDEFEILTLNEHGESIGAGNGRVCN